MSKLGGLKASYVLGTKVLMSGGVEEMKNHVFEGQMSVQDYDHRAANSATGFSELIYEPLITTAIRH